LSLYSCQLQTLVPSSAKREAKADFFQFMFDMLIILWYNSDIIPVIVTKPRPL
jgi:hypothetical protein